MILTSLKVRLLLIQSIVIILALGITGFGIVYLFDRQVERRINTELNTYLNQIAAGVKLSPTGEPVLTRTLADPRFSIVYSGLYWQIKNETSNLSTRSRSLWDVELSLPVDKPPFGKVHIHTIKGPEGSTLSIHERRLLYKSPIGEQTLRLVVALDMVDVNIMSSEFSLEILISLLILAGFLLIAAWIQIAVGLKPLKYIQKSIAAIRTGEETRITAPLPSEVLPLVTEVNDLLEAQEKAIIKAKNRSNDLAHGFKTPLTALKTDVQRLRDKGENEIASDIETMFLALRRQIERELATSRARDLTAISGPQITHLLKGISTTLKRTPAGEDKIIEIICDQNISVQADMDDLAEILGNLVENAVKHANQKIAVTVKTDGPGILFIIEDDGNGISKKKRDLALKRGVRFDQSVAGSGLGLAITSDILEAYHSHLMLDDSSLGGLKVYFSIAKTL